MALFHLSVTQTKRSAGQSAIASAAYRAGERLYSEYYGEYSDYTRKGGVICSDILLPSHAPPEYADRQTLWNAVEKAKRGKNAQLAYSFDIALQNEFSLEENIGFGGPGGTTPQLAGIGQHAGRIAGVGPIRKIGRENRISKSAFFISKAGKIVRSQLAGIQRKMYKLVPAERQKHSNETITKNRCKP